MQVRLYYQRALGGFKRPAVKIQAKKKFSYYPAVRMLFQHIIQKRDTKRGKERQKETKTRSGLSRHVQFKSLLPALAG